MASSEPFLVINDLSGGMNLTDPVQSVGENQVIDAYDVEWYQSPMPRQRKGALLEDTTGFAPAGTYEALFKHTPQGTAGETGVELWALTSTPTLGRGIAGPTWASVSIGDTMSNPEDAQAVSFHNKLYLAYNSNVDRLHVWDGTSVRRTGVSQPAAPTVANTGAGAYAATLRYYKVSYIELSGSTIVRRSLLSSAVSFTPSGAGTAARVTKPAAVSEGETHWELWGSSDGSNYYRLATTAVGTTTYDDSAAPSSYSSGTLAPAEGDYTVPPSARYLMVHQNRLLLARSWETTGYDSRIWWTPILGETGEGDDERVPIANSLDVDPGLYGPITGFGMALGDPVVFKSTALYKLVPTGDASAPYQVLRLSDTIGCLHQRSVVQGVDENGAPCVYWLSRRGPYRYGVQGIQYLGHDIEALWDNWVSTTGERRGHGVFYTQRNQVWWWFQQTGESTPDTTVVFHTQYGRSAGGDVRGGWTRYTNLAAKCSCLWPTLGATYTSLYERPVMGRTSGTAIWRADASTSGDPSSGYTAMYFTRPYVPFGPMQRCGVTEARIGARALSNRNISLILLRDFGEEQRTFTVSLTASATETHVLRPISTTPIYRRYEDVALTAARNVIVKVYDGQPTTPWQVDEIVLRVRPEEVA